MDVDDGDVSAGLLEQLHSLQTVDHDDLVSQMLRLVGQESLTVENAKFYLEMNGWNVQAAVCAYFDLEAGPEARAAPPAMTFVKDVTIGEGESVPPDTVFVKTWKVQNSGGDKWPEGCLLVHTDGTLMTSDGRDRVPVDPPLLPFQLRDLSLEMRSPSSPGIFQSKWRLSTRDGLFFGDTIWVIITVERAGTLALTQQMNNFTALGSSCSTSLEDAQSNDEDASPHRRTSALSNPFSPRKFGGADDQEMS